MTEQVAAVTGSDRPSFRCAVVLAVAVLIGTAALVLDTAGTGVAPHAGDVATSATGVAALWACCHAARRPGVDSRGWTLLAVAMGIWTAAQVVWTYEGFRQGHSGGQLSLADIGFLGYSIPAIAALFAFRRDSVRLVTRVRALVDGLSIATAILFSSWVVVLGPIVRQSSEGWATSAIGLAYPLLDAAIASLVLLLVMRKPSGARLPLALLACGLVILAVANTTFLSLSTSGALTSAGSLMSIGWVAALLLVALAALAPSRATSTRIQELTPAQELLPYIPVGIALVCSAAVDVFADPFLIWDGLVMLLLVGVRQVMIIFEKQELATGLERRVAERTTDLQVAQEDLRQTFDDAPIGMVWSTPAGVLVRVNTAFCDMLGYTPGELIGTAVADITVPGDLLPTVELADRAVASPATVSLSRVEKRYRHKSGGVVWAEVSLSVTRDAAGAAKYFLAQVQDVTDKRAAVRAKDNQATFLEAVLENLDSGVVACDAHGRLTITNRALRELYSLPDVLSELDNWPTHLDLYHPGGVVPMAPHEVPLVRALHGDHVVDVEFVIKVKDHHQKILIANGHAIHDTEGELLGAVITLHDITQRRSAEAALYRQALHDPLTDLANRALLRDRLEHAIARQSRQPDPLALVLLDLDGFKLVNDSLGHQAGDQVLITLARRLRSCLRSDDTIARLGGDEFAVVLENTSELEATAIAGQILAEIRKPVVIQARPITSDASVGIVISTATDTPDSLLRNADLAMYAAKDFGKGNIQLFKAAMHETVLERLTLDAELRRALLENQFTLVYQPIVSLRTGRLQGFEALVRWTHPERGEISPATFIPLTEATGLIVPLGQWVLREACRQAAAWRAEVPGAQELSMSVNLSVRQLQDPAIFDIVSAALADSEFPAEYLHLEITESVFEHRGQVILDMLHRLHATGVRLVVDDFGTGYSSLSRLHALPIDKVKIDKSFVDMLDGGGAAPMVAATIAMAHSLGLQAVAEGVESADQIPFLLLNNCDDAQGFLFGRPIDGTEMDVLLREQTPSARWRAVATGAAAGVPGEGAVRVQG